MYSLDLTSAWAKFRRGEKHVNAFRASVERKVGPHPIDFALSHKYEADEAAVVYRIDRTIEIEDEWSLTIADAIHNFRAALDHLAWQLALRYFAGSESDCHRARRDIQFPFVEMLAGWPSNRFRRYMVPSDADQIEPEQPFHADPIAIGRNLPHPFIMLSTLSNTDKHRNLQLLFAMPAVYTLNPPQVTDCVITGYAKGGIDLGASPQVGDKVLAVPVCVTGPNPDVDFDTSLSCYIGIRDGWNVDDVLAMIKERVERVLRRF